MRPRQPPRDDDAQLRACSSSSKYPCGAPGNGLASTLGELHRPGWTRGAAGPTMIRRLFSPARSSPDRFHLDRQMRGLPTHLPTNTQCRRGERVVAPPAVRARTARPALRVWSAVREARGGSTSSPPSPKTLTPSGRWVVRRDRVQVQQQLAPRAAAGQLIPSRVQRLERHEWRRHR